MILYRSSKSPGLAFPAQKAELPHALHVAVWSKARVTYTHLSESKSIISTRTVPLPFTGFPTQISYSTH
jgi:hypothetical protein